MFAGPVAEAGQAAWRIPAASAAGIVRSGPGAGRDVREWEDRNGVCVRTGRHRRRGRPTGRFEARLAEKAKRTPAQRKVSSQLLDARRAADTRRQDKGEVVEDEMVMVDIRADVTPAVLARIRALGGTVTNSVARYRAIRARLPLHAVEKLATLDAIQSIRPRRRGGHA